MICIQTSKEAEKYMLNYFKCVLDNESHSPSELLEYAKGYVKAYEFKHSSELPSFVDEISGE